MIFIKYLNLIEQLDQSIRLQATGNPKKLAKELNISRTVLWDIMNIMKDLDAPIYYDKYKKSYCYSENVKFEIEFKKIPSQ